MSSYTEEEMCDEMNKAMCADTLSISRLLETARERDDLMDQCDAVRDILVPLGANAHDDAGETAQSAADIIVSLQEEIKSLKREYGVKNIVKRCEKHDSTILYDSVAGDRRRVSCAECSDEENEKLRQVSLEAILERQSEWSRKTFGKYSHWRRFGLVDHLRKEIEEVFKELSEGGDALFEFVDVALLAFDGMMASGLCANSVMNNLLAKIEDNERRQWPKIEDQVPGKAVEHVKDVDELTREWKKDDSNEPTEEKPLYGDGNPGCGGASSLSSESGTAGQGENLCKPGCTLSDDSVEDRTVIGSGYISELLNETLLGYSPHKVNISGFISSTTRASPSSAISNNFWLSVSEEVMKRAIEEFRNGLIEVEFVMKTRKK